MRIGSGWEVTKKQRIEKQEKITFDADCEAEEEMVLGKLQCDPLESPACRELKERRVYVCVCPYNNNNDQMILTPANNGEPTTIYPGDEGKVVVDAVCDPDTGTYTITVQIGYEGESAEVEAGEETNVESVTCNNGND